MIKKILLCGLAAGTLLFSACTKSDKSAEEPVKIGAIFAYTGGASFLGEPERKTAVLMEEKINNEGGILGRKIKFIIKDTGAEPQKAVNAVKELVTKENVVAIVGPTTSGVSLAIKKEMNNMMTTLVSCAADERIVTPVSESKWIFKSPQSDRMAITKIFYYMKEKGIKKIGLITADAGFGLGGAMQATKLAPEFGIEILTHEKYSSKDPDVNTQVTKIRSKNPQAILCWDTDQGSAKVVKSIRSMGMNLPVFMSHGIANIGFLKASGKAGEGVIFPCGRLVVAEQLDDNHPQKKLLMEYREEYIKRYNEEPNTFGGHAYDAIMVLKKGIELAGSFDKSAIRESIEKVQNFNGTAGEFNFSENDHNGLDSSAFCFVTVENGRWKFMQE